ncbi:MAG: FtsX-like permease family protein [Halieaceae bacterium]
MIAWRNLWRNRRRTLFTAGGIAFACLLLMFSRSIQLGSYRGMIDAATDLLSGHVQVQHQDFLDDPRLEYRIGDAAALVASLGALPEVEMIAPRAQAFALLSVDEKGFGAQVLGVDPAAEQAISTLPGALSEGRYLQAGNEAFIGRTLARNLGAQLGDEIVILGSGPEGGVAALAVTLVGIFETGQAELDRALVEVPLDVFQAGFYLDDEVHQLVMKLASHTDVVGLSAQLGEQLPVGLVAHPWQALMPEVVQAIALDRISARLFYSILTLVVLFSIVNTFVMTVFERTREFGMMLAIGMHPWRLIAMLQVEAFWLALLGGILGCLLALAPLVWIIHWGIPMEGREEWTAGFAFPSHLKGAFDLWEMLAIPLVFIVGCQFSAFLPGLRVRSLQPVEALRAD